MIQLIKSLETCQKIYSNYCCYSNHIQSIFLENKYKSLVGVMQKLKRLRIFSGNQLIALLGSENILQITVYLRRRCQSK